MLNGVITARRSYQLCYGRCLALSPLLAFIIAISTQANKRLPRTRLIVPAHNISTKHPRPKSANAKEAINYHLADL